MEMVARDLTKCYRDGTIALANFTHTWHSGVVHGLLGANGAGKTTLLRMCATLERPTAGLLQVGAWNVQERAARRHIRTYLGYKPQVFQFYDELTATEFLAYMGRLKGLETGQVGLQTIHRVLEQVNLAGVAQRPLGSFSGGMKQRVCLAQALLGSPRLLLLDEPTAGLDPAERTRLYSLLAELAAHALILLSTHLTEDVARLCDQVTVLQQGRQVFQGSPQTLADRAHGRVWELEAPPNLILSDTVVLAQTPVATGIRYRLYADRAPHPSAVPVSRPTLEDSYLYLCSEDAHHAKR